MRAQFCVYACALPLAGAHGCTGLFSDKVKLTGKPHYSVGDAFPTCFRDVYVITPIMVKGGAEVPGVDGVGGPCATEGGFFVH